MDSLSELTDGSSSFLTELSLLFLGVRREMIVALEHKSAIAISSNEDDKDEEDDDEDPTVEKNRRKSTTMTKESRIPGSVEEEEEDGEQKASRRWPKSCNESAHLQWSRKPW